MTINYFFYRFSKLKSTPWDQTTLLGQTIYYILQLFIGTTCVTILTDFVTVNLGPQIYMEVFCDHFENYFTQIEEIIKSKKLSRDIDTRSCIIKAMGLQLKIYRWYFENDIFALRLTPFWFVNSLFTDLSMIASSIIFFQMTIGAAYLSLTTFQLSVVGCHTKLFYWTKFTDKLFFVHLLGIGRSRFQCDCDDYFINI